MKGEREEEGRETNMIMMIVFFFNCSALLHIHTAVTSLELLDMPNDMDQCKGRVISYYSSVLPRIFRVVVRF